MFEKTNGGTDGGKRGGIPGGRGGRALGTSECKQASVTRSNMTSLNHTKAC